VPSPDTVPLTMAQGSGRKSPLQGKVAIVTGASSGVGPELALMLGQAGMRVALAARRPDPLRETAEQTAAQGVEALAVPTDIADSAACTALVQRTLEAFGRLDVLVNNAGVGTWSRVEDTSDDEWERVLKVNLDGVFYLTRAALPALRETRGSLVNVVSNLGRVGSDSWSAYCAAKFGVVGFSEALSWELYGSGVRILLLYPGLIATGFHRSMPRMPDLAGVPALSPRQVARIALDRLLEDPGERIEHISFEDTVPEMIG
jgi:3-oxoacyl-[acyl-carrier protein] reductase